MKTQKYLIWELRKQGRTRLQTRSTFKEVFPRGTCRDLRSRVRFVSTGPMVRRFYTLPCFAPPQSFLKRFALRWWQLKCRFAASSAPKQQYVPPTHSQSKVYKHKGEPVCRTRSTLKEVPPPAILHVGFYQKTGLSSDKS